MQSMMELLEVTSLDDLMQKVVPEPIARQEALQTPEAVSEPDFLSEMRELANKNSLFKNFIGQGYYGTHTPSVIQRNILENPGWYTQYTPYQAEIAQGRLEALLNFQTMVSGLTGLPLANASLLDEATAAAEAMTMLFSVVNKKRKKNPALKFFVDDQVFVQTVDVLETRAEPLGIEIVRGKAESWEANEEYFGVLIQFPNAEGEIIDWEKKVETWHEAGLRVAVAADLMSLSLLRPPGEWGADVVVGNTQRFGVPLGAGGPHAAYFATVEKYKRQIPGRIIGVSVDREERPAFRMALQTREQHIKRDRATSNICTAQALLAIMASMYAVYHGPEGIRSIARTIRSLTYRLADKLIEAGLPVKNRSVFDTLSISLSHDDIQKVKKVAEERQMNFWYTSKGIQISMDEVSREGDIQAILEVFQEALGTLDQKKDEEIALTEELSETMRRSTPFMEHEIFHLYRSETDMMRYIKKLENKDLSLTHSMISLGSCTMKLNAATQLMPITWPEFSSIHPFAPVHQRLGYKEIIDDLSDYLSDITGFAACSFQPNSGAQGEYAGLMTIREFHKDHGEGHRNIALIPESAHGTNPASAVMAGMKVVVVSCDEKGNIDIEDVRKKVEEHKDKLAAMMVTYPSTHGVFEREIKDICQLVHDHGGLLYMDGANMNAQVGYTSPGHIDADVCHLNLHKTFAIPHGGGGPGMGPICVNKKLAPYLPTHRYDDSSDNKRIPVSAAPYGSPSILLISYAYIRLLGPEGMKKSTAAAILNANYIKKKLEDKFDILYAGQGGYCAHEFIVDLRPFKPIGVGAEDIAKRLIDYGFHAPTMSFPVPGTIMIEPTESESLDELNRFIQAMRSIHQEIDKIAAGDWPSDNNPLVNAPHCIQWITADEWTFPYTRQKAAYPLPYLHEGKKFWTQVARVDNAYGDRNLICTCPPLEDYA